jgi:tetratricopeptide (TPR) repeat protein
MILGSLNENDFEDWLASYFRAAYKLPRPAQRNGRRGQRQHGVDVYFQSADDEWIGVQAKAYTETRLTAAAVDAELALAHQFQPALSRYIVCTLNKRDARLQEHVRGLRLHGRPTVEIIAVEDLAEAAARDQAVLEDLVRRIGAPFHDAMRQVLGVPAPAMSPAVADPDPDQDASLKAIDAWIDEGYPDKALVALASYSGPAGTVAWLRVRVRAQFAKQDYEPVLDAAREQLAETVPDPVLIAQGAHAAQLLGRPDLADEWLARAVRDATPTTRPLVVGAYVRVHALRGHYDAETLERFARDQLGDPLPVALAVADASFMLGDVERAVAWYRAARDRQAHWPATSHGNALSAEIWLHIEAADRGLPNNQRLNECTRELAGMVTSVRTPGLRTPLVMNLGFAYLALGNAAGAAEAWDEVLQTEEATDDLWLRRCMVSAAHGAALPEDAAEARWATTPTGRLALPHVPSKGNGIVPRL